MKKAFQFHLLIGLAALLVAGCSLPERDGALSFRKSQPAAPARSAVRAFIGEPGTKTSLGDFDGTSYPVNWSEDDRIALYIDNARDAALFTLVSGAGSREASFEGPGAGEQFTALFPYAMAGTLEGGFLSLTLPEEQTYTLKSFGVNNFPMLGTGTPESISFRNLCAVLKLSLRGGVEVDSIRFTAADASVRVSGLARVAVNGGAEPQLEMLDGGSPVVTLACNIFLNRTEATDFYLVLPPGTYPGGFSIDVLTPTGSMHRTTTETLTLGRSQLWEVEEMEVVLDSGMEPSQSLSGQGSESDPFLISSVSDLLLLAACANSEQKMIPSSEGGSLPCSGLSGYPVHYRLTNDLDLSAFCAPGKMQWTGIGRAETGGFFALFDGDGHRISHLYISGTKSDQGFFGCLSDGAITNLEVSGEVSGNEHIGLLAGYAPRTVFTNCVARGKVSASGRYSGGLVGVGDLFYDCSNYADVTSSSDYVGGIAGEASFIVENCRNAGTVSGDGTYVGGIAGSTGSLVCNSFNQGTVLCGGGGGGGIVGRGYSGSITNCLNVGTVGGARSNFAHLYSGAIVGFRVEASIQHNYWLYDPDTDAGMLVGVGGTQMQEEWNFPLTAPQLSGVQGWIDGLYVDATGHRHYYLCDALNARASELDFTVAKGWINGGAGYPVLNDKLAELPSVDPSTILLLSPARVSLSGAEQTFDVDVLAGTSFHVVCPSSWIEYEGETASRDQDGLARSTHRFRVEANGSAMPRSGVVSFCDDVGRCLPFQVAQGEQLDPDNGWRYKDFWHTTVAFHYSSTDIHSQRGPMDETAKILGDSFERAVFHQAYSNLASEATLREAVREQYGGIEGEYFVIDGRAAASGVPEMVELAYEADDYGTATGISLESRVSDAAVEADVKLYVKYAGEYKLSVWLLEDGIVAGQREADDSYNPNYIHDRIVRRGLTETPTGDPFLVEEDGTVKDLHFSAPLESGWNPEHLRLLVFVQRKYGAERYYGVVFSGVFSGGYFGGDADYYIDNSLSVPVGTAAPLRFVEGGPQQRLYESTDYSRDGNVTVLNRASKGKGVNLVLVCDGFSDKDEALFLEYAQRAFEAFFAVEPYRSLRDRFNVYAVYAVSKNSYVSPRFETRFGCWMDAGGSTHIGGNDQDVFDFVAGAIPGINLSHTTIAVIAHSTAYCGTCYMYTDGASIGYLSLETSKKTFDDVFRHEVAGHGAGKLADEYVEQYFGIPSADVASFRESQGLGWYENIDFTPSSSAVRWAHMISDDRYAGQVWIYEGGGTYQYGVYRPTQWSIMNDNAGCFNAPSRESIYKKIMRWSEGTSWKYDYETFVAFDSPAREQWDAYYGAVGASTKSVDRTSDESSLPRLHPPVIKKR